jgi:hypothetical protein
LVEATGDTGFSGDPYNNTSFAAGWCDGVFNDETVWEFPVTTQTPMICDGTPLAYMWHEIIEAGVTFDPRSTYSEIQAGDVLAIQYDDRCGPDGWKHLGATWFNICEEWKELGIIVYNSGTWDWTNPDGAGGSLDVHSSRADIDCNDSFYWDSVGSDWQAIIGTICPDEEDDGLGGGSTGHTAFVVEASATPVGTADFERDHMGRIVALDIDITQGEDDGDGSSPGDRYLVAMGREQWYLDSQAPPNQRGKRVLWFDAQSDSLHVDETTDTGTTSEPVPLGTRLVYVPDPRVERARRSELHPGLGACVPLPRFPPAPNPAGHCEVSTPVPVNLSPHELVGLTVAGGHGSLLPDAARVRRSNGGPPVTTPWATPVVGMPWDASPPVGALACQNGTCSGTYTVEIDRAPADQSCKDYTPVSLCFGVENGLARRRVTTASDCAAGSGSFHLVPVEARDQDRDGIRTSTFLPLMTSGAGTMTNAAWITSTQVTEDRNYTLRMIRSNQDFSYDASDALVSPSTVSVTLSQTTQSWADGDLSGNAPVVVEGIPPGGTPSLKLELSWNCSAGSATWTPVTPAGTGYRLDLGAAGCGATQRLTLRKLAGRIEWSWYGDPNLNRVTTTTAVTGGEDFAWGEGPLEIEGTWVSDDGQQATVELDSVTLYDLPVCAPGTYLLPLE